MRNDCLYCHRDITLDDLFTQINSNVFHVHYCTECVQVCIECSELKPIYAFAYDRSTPEWEEWSQKGRTGHPSKAAYQKICSHCNRKAQDQELALAAQERRERALQRRTKQLAMVRTPAIQAALEKMLAASRKNPPGAD